MSTKCLLINPPFSSNVYEESKVKVSAPEYPPLTLTTLAAPIKQSNIEVSILDLTIVKNPKEEIERNLEKINPTYVGITFTTPQFSSMKKTAELVKNYNKNIIVMGGGPHASADPISSLKNSDLDIISIGESDFSIVEILNTKKIEFIKGIFFKKDEKIISTNTKNFIEDLNKLPFPAWELIDIKKYDMPPLYRKKTPVGPMETSRGCPFGCVYCNKNIFGRTFRTKSPPRVIEEIEFMLNLGFKEIHFIDDTFTNDIDRAKKICDEIITSNINFSWNLPNGVRVDRVDKELFEKMYKAGCYRIGFGVESGDEEVLKNINKGTTLDKIRNTFKLVKDIGIETTAFFMLALPGETEETMQKTIDFAKELDPDVAKFSICTPLPGTSQFIDWNDKGLIKTMDWDKYIFHKKGEKIFDHPNLNWEKIDEYYDKAYREFYLRPKYILKRLKKFNWINDFRSFISTKW